MSDKNEVKNLVDPSALSIVSSGKKISQPKEDFENIVNEAANVGAGMGTDELYDRFMKLIYVIDNSGSMFDGMALTDSIARYEWTPEALKVARKEMTQYLKENPVKQTTQSDDEDFDDEDDFDDFDEEPLFASVPDDDEELKQLIVEAGLISELKLKIPMKSTYNRSFGATKSKIETVKDAARGFVQKRYAKFPEANVMLFGFDSEAYVLGRGISEAEVVAAIDKLDANGGDTRIISAVKTAISECKKRPSEVGAHHVVLVTDGYDNESGYMTDILPQLLEMHIVLDFIFVKGQSESENDRSYKSKIDAIKEVCEKTHGEYTEVGTVADFEIKFLAASSRPMLPWK